MARDFGGEMRLRLAGGQNLTMRGSFTLGSSGLSVESMTNQDGSVSRSATLRARTAELTLEDGGENLDALLRAPRQDVYIVEDFTRVSHIFTQAVFTGDPRVDRATGELTDLVVEGSGYQRLGG